MHRILIALALCAAAAIAAATPDRPPKLIVAITIDQFRYDYLNRFRSEYKGGLARLLKNGAVFTNAYYQHFPTVTAIGHSTFLSGATPSLSGIVGNEWYDRESGKQVTSVSDETTKLLGSDANRSGSSPRRLLVSTIGDELKMSNGNKSRVVGISSKDRSAVLPVGRMADGAYWFDTQTGNFVSSTYYFDAMPGWAAKFNASRAVDQWLGKDWIPFDAKADAKPFRKLGNEPNRAYYDALDRTPYSNELIVAFAQAAVEGENLGRNEGTDVLAVSFSANDRVGHQVGPDAPQVRDISVQTDRTLAGLFEFLDKRIGADGYMVVVTADHGVAPLPELMRERKMPGGRMPEGAVLNAVQEALTGKFGEGKWVVGKSGPAPYLNYQLIEQKGLSRLDVQNAAADAVRAVPHVYRVYTKPELQAGRVLDDLVDRRVTNGFHPQRASDLFVVAEPYWLFERSGTSHGTPYNYDAHVPLIFMGPRIKPGSYHGNVAINDIAPTLATLLGIEMPSGAAGRVLAEMFMD